LILVGGHAPGMKQYLESQILQKKIADFWELNRPVAAICHGVLLAGRCKDQSGKSILFNKKTTTLPKYMENLGYYITRWSYGKLYRTYEVTIFKFDVILIINLDVL
jgi:putative intracellular protease/amidase